MLYVSLVYLAILLVFATGVVFLFSKKGITMGILMVVLSLLIFSIVFGIGTFQFLKNVIFCNVVDYCNWYIIDF